MKRFLSAFLCIFLFMQIGCSRADIHTRQKLSANETLSSATLESVAVPTFVKRNEIASVTVRGEPEKIFSISVHLSSGVSKAKGLEPAKSDENGFVSWSWKISKQTTPGQYRITVTCGGEIADTYFTIEP